MRRPAAARPAPARRRLFGQHVTRNDVSDLICAFCVRRADASVLDPACGSGDMLRRAAARLARLAPEGVLPGGRLTGTEIDPLLAARAREALPGAEIRTADFLAGRPRVQPRLFDAIVGNPPYVRQELLDTARKRALLSALPPLRGAPAASRRADLHLYFWPRALELLAPGGRLGFITSAAWLDAAYGAWLRRCLSDGFRVVAVIESAVESWFDDARVRSAVTVIERVSPAGAPPARFVRLEARLEDLVPRNRDEPERLAGFEELARRLGRDSPADPIAPAGSSVRIRRVPAGALGADPWGPALRMPEIYFEILAQAAGRLIPLAEVAEVRWGIKTGDDSFFCPDRDEAASFDPRFVVPIAFSLMELNRLEVRSETLRRRLLRIDTRRPDHREALTGPAGVSLARRIHDAQRLHGSHLRPTCAAREGRPDPGRRWYELRPGPPGAILWSIMHQYRHLAPLNTGATPVNDNLLQITPRDGLDARLLAALLNSHLVGLLKHACGRQRNEGMLKTQAGDVRRLRVPDPRRFDASMRSRLVDAFRAIGSRRIGRITDECLLPDRRHLDVAVLEAIGYPPEGAARAAERVAAALVSLHGGERLGELDAMAQRRRHAREARHRAVRPRA